MDYQRSDAMLMEILQERKTITGFLDAIFGFLRRNTDYYHTKHSAEEKIGFDKGMRDKILYGAMQRYDPDCLIQTMTAESDIEVDGTQVPPAVEEIVVETIKERKPLASTQPANTKTKRIFETSDFKNGAVFEHHCWSQTLSDLELHLELPEDLKTAKQLNIEIKPQRIKVSSKAGPMQTILEGALSQRIRHNEVMWSIDDARLSISCDKAKEGWWERLFESDAEIDITKLDTGRYIDELPQDSQTAIEKLRVKQMAADKQQQTDNPTDPEQAKTFERLKKAWDAEGSPFKGQPFDPSMVRMS
ncbi:CG31251 [Drosophila busckii]|uniref:Nuclear migration protein nudC n=1 Tax=Drosophila busckii TaxID=30019 RepID=A0A0M3QWK0_DROBS|nr:CG31251 [Drosophila busckii]